MVINTKQILNKNRNGAADLLKGIAVLLMIQVHLMEQFATPDLYQSSFGKISLFLGGPACAPVFMAIMGYFMAVSHKKMGALLRRGLLLFTGGLVLNFARSANLLIQIFKGNYDLNPWHFILGADILTLAGLSVILIGLLRLLFRANYLPYLILAILIVLVTPFISVLFTVNGQSAYLLAFFGGIYEWSYFPLFPWMAYVLTGYACFLFTEHVSWANREKLLKFAYLIIPMTILTILSLPWASVITANLKGEGGYYHHGILFFLWTVLFMISYVTAVNLIAKRFPEKGPYLIIKWMGRNVTAIYVFQWLVIGNIATVLFRSRNLLQLAAWFVMVTLSSSLLAAMYQQVLSYVKREP